MFFTSMSEIKQMEGINKDSATLAMFQPLAWFYRIRTETFEILAELVSLWLLFFSFVHSSEHEISFRMVYTCSKVLMSLDAPGKNNCKRCID